MKKTIFVILFFFLTLSACNGSSTSVNGDSPDNELDSFDIGFLILHSSERIENGSFTEKSFKIISSQDSYEIELSKYSNDAPVLIDFSKATVLLLDMGQETTSGYSIKVSNIKEEDDFVSVSVVTEEPGSGCAVDTALTNPYQFVRIETKKAIIFNELPPIKTVCN